jgi:hypothetical protein
LPTKPIHYMQKLTHSASLFASDSVSRELR